MITYYWNRKPGNFLKKKTGELLDLPFKFDGTVREWYETLIETMIDVRNAALGPTGKDATIPIRCSPETLPMLECSVLYRPHVDPDQKILCQECAKAIGPTPSGLISQMFLVTADASVPKNEILVGDFGKVVVQDDLH